jgi:hypothetical protein
MSRASRSCGRASPREPSLEELFLAQYDREPENAAAGVAVTPDGSASAGGGPRRHASVFRARLGATRAGSLGIFG